MRAPRGFYAVCGTLLAGAVAVIGFDLAHHQPGGGAVQAGPRPRVVVSRAVPVVSSPRPSVVPRVGVAPPEAPGGASAATGGGSPSVLPSPATSPVPASSRKTPTPAPVPSPQPTRVPLVEVSVAVAVTPRASSSGAERLPVVVPAAPPFPTPSAGLLALLRVR